MPPYLPPELIENIMGHIDDQKTLAACSLICRAWTPFAQSEFFRILHLGPSLDRTTTFLQMVHQSPHIALLPRTLISDHWVPRVVDDGTNLAQIAPVLIKVSKLSLVSISLLDLPSHNLRTIVEGFPSLRQLFLDTCTIDVHVL